MFLRVGALGFVVVFWLICDRCCFWVALARFPECKRSNSIVTSVSIGISCSSGSEIDVSVGFSAPFPVICSFSSAERAPLRSRFCFLASFLCSFPFPLGLVTRSSSGPGGHVLRSCVFPAFPLQESQNSF